MDCCTVNGLDQEFTRSWARKESRSYRKKGLNKRVGKLLGFLKAEGLREATVLDIGCGIGALHLELLKQGARKATGVDVSPAYIEEATALAQELGLEEDVEYHLGDFVELERGIAQADIVLLDRVICCYPDVKALVTASARHAERAYVLSYPPWAWWQRAGTFLLNLLNAVRRRRFRSFVHDPQEVRAILTSEGLAPVSEVRSGVWEIAVYRRQ